MFFKKNTVTQWDADRGTRHGGSSLEVESPSTDVKQVQTNDNTSKYKYNCYNWK